MLSCATCAVDQTVTYRRPPRPTAPASRSVASRFYPQNSIDFPRPYHGSVFVGSWLWHVGGVIGQATVAMFVRVELRDLCGRRLEPEKGRCGLEGFARSGINAKGA